MPAAKPAKPEAKQPPADQAALARALLGRALGFKDCTAATLDALVAAGRIRHLSKGEQLGQRGAPFDFLGLVVEGSIEASMTRHDGHRHLTSYLQPGDLVGMIGLLDGLGHLNDLHARGSASVMLIPGDAIRRLRAADVQLVYAFERQLAFRSRLLYERLSADPSLPLEMRLARLLHTLGSLYGLPRGAEVILDMKISQADLGDWLGASRQRVNFVIQQLQQVGLIRVRYSTITIASPAGLAAYVSV
jgi:CRP/FNR family cyclic AMP-dependent transcriptional regulator